MVATTFCRSGAALAKAGRNVSKILSGGDFAIGSDFIVDVWITEAESVINNTTRKNWSDVYTGLNSGMKFILGDVASCLAGMNCINFDMSGYTSRAEAEIMLDVLRDKVVRGMELLADKKVEDFMD